MIPTTRFNRLLLLVITSTLIAEILSGSTTLSRIQYLPTQFIMYGSAAILIRETARRINAGWPVIILLGLAFGLTLEGLVLQSVFNPVFLGNNLSYGRSMGVNWVWAAYMPGFHAIWAVCTPVLICETYYDDHQQPWGSRTVIWISAAVFLLICTAFHFLFIKMTKFDADLFLLAITLALVCLIILLALSLQKLQLQATAIRPLWMISVLTFIAAVCWYAGFVNIFAHHKIVPWIAITAAPVIAVVYFSIVKRIRISTGKERVALIAGLLGAIGIWGYFSTEGNRTDHIAQIVLICALVPLLYLLYKRADKNDVWPGTQLH